MGRTSWDASRGLSTDRLCKRHSSQGNVSAPRRRCESFPDTEGALLAKSILHYSVPRGSGVGPAPGAQPRARTGSPRCRRRRAADGPRGPPGPEEALGRAHAGPSSSALPGTGGRCWRRASLLSGYPNTLVARTRGFLSVCPGPLRAGLGFWPAGSLYPSVCGSLFTPSVPSTAPASVRGLETLPAVTTSR